MHHNVEVRYNSTVPKDLKVSKVSMITDFNEKDDISVRLQ